MAGPQVAKLFCNRLSIVVVTVLVVLAGTGCSPNRAESAAQGEQEEERSVSVEVEEVRRGDIQQTYGTITTLEAEREAKIVARSSGILQDIAVEEGDLVEAGQILAQLDTEQLSLEVAQLEAVVKRLKADLEREQTLVARQLGTTTNLERARSDYQSQQAQLDLALLKLRYATIRAPFAGMITRRSVRTGNLIQLNDELFTLVDPHSMQAVLHLPQKELSRAAVGQPALLSVDAFPGKTIPGTIDRIRPQIDTDTGTFQVIVAIDNPSGLLQSGMFGRVELIFDTRVSTLLLAGNALVTQDNRSHVFIVREGKAVQTAVELGIKHRNTVEIVSGLQEDDSVVVTGQTILKDGSPVDVIGA